MELEPVSSRQEEWRGKTGRGRCSSVQCISGGGVISTAVNSDAVEGCIVSSNSVNVGTFCDAIDSSTLPNAICDDEGASVNSNIINGDTMDSVSGNSRTRYGDDISTVDGITVSDDAVDSNSGVDGITMSDDAVDSNSGVDGITVSDDAVDSNSGVDGITVSDDAVDSNSGVDGIMMSDDAVDSNSSVDGITMSDDGSR